MRILMLAPRFPYPPDRGDTLRSWNILSRLAASHEVWLACVDSRPPAAAHLQRVRRLCREVAVFDRPAWVNVLRGLRSLMTGGSVTEAYFSDPRLEQTVARWSQAEPFDALLTYSSSVASAAAHARARRRVLDLCDVDSLKWRRYARVSRWPLRWLYGLETERVAELEARATCSHDFCLLVNERERKKFAGLFPDVTAAVVPTTVDLSEFEPAPLAADPVVGTLGAMSYPPNVHAVNWFGRFVWPLVKARQPDARWLIVGRDPVRSVRNWGRLPGVEVTGHVPDVRPYLAAMRAFADPVRGDIGVQSKLLVAMATGRPAVVTSDVAAGLTCTGAPPCLVANSPRDFAAAVVRLLNDEELCRRLGGRARELMEARYAAGRQLEMLERLLAGEPAGGGRRRRRAEELTPA